MGDDAADDAAEEDAAARKIQNAQRARLARREAARRRKARADAAGAVPVLVCAGAAAGGMLAVEIELRTNNTAELRVEPARGAGGRAEVWSGRWTRGMLRALREPPVSWHVVFSERDGATVRAACALRVADGKVRVSERTGRERAPCPDALDLVAAVDTDDLALGAPVWVAPRAAREAELPRALAVRCASASSRGGAARGVYHHTPEWANGLPAWRREGDAPMFLFHHPVEDRWVIAEAIGTSARAGAGGACIVFVDTPARSPEGVTGWELGDGGGQAALLVAAYTPLLAGSRVTAAQDFRSSSRYAGDTTVALSRGQEGAVLLLEKGGASVRFEEAGGWRTAFIESCNFPALNERRRCTVVASGAERVRVHYASLGEAHDEWLPRCGDPRLLGRADDDA